MHALSPNRATEVPVALFLLGSLALVVTYRSVYWELSPRCLLIRKLWTKKQIPWNEVTRVGWLGTRSGTFSISIGHAIENYDRFYIEPRDQARFIAAVREFAVHATFELE